MPTQIIDGFRLNAATPIDSRLVTTGTASRNSMAYKYEGLRVYDTIQKTPFVYINGDWEEESTKAVITTSGSVTNMQMNGSENYIPKITSYGTTNSIIREYIATGNTRRIGINVPNTTPITATLHVIGSSLFDGQVNATNFVGKISGNDVQFPVNVDKLNNPNTTGTYVLKSINNTNQWVAETTGSKIVISKNTTDEKLFLVLAKDIDTTGVGNQLYINNNNTSDSLAVNASTRQIMAGTSNTYAKPQYSFIDTTGTGMYGNSTEIGLSMDGNKRIYVSTDSVSINIAQINKVKFESTLTTINTATEISGSNTLKVGGTTTLNDSLTVATDKSTTLGGTLTVTNNTQLNGTLNVATGKSTTLGGTLTVTDASTLNTLNVTGASTLNTLTVTGASTLNNTLTVSGNTSITDSFTFTVGGSTTLNTLTVNGISTLNNNLVVSPGKSTTLGGTLTVNGNTSITGDVGISGWLSGNVGFTTPLERIWTNWIKINDILQIQSINSGSTPAYIGRYASDQNSTRPLFIRVDTTTDGQPNWNGDFYFWPTGKFETHYLKVKNPTKTITFSVASGSGTNYTHNLEYIPIAVVVCQDGNVNPNITNINSSTIRIYNYNTGGNTATGTIYLW